MHLGRPIHVAAVLRDVLIGILSRLRQHDLALLYRRSARLFRRAGDDASDQEARPRSARLTLRGRQAVLPQSALPQVLATDLLKLADAHRRFLLIDDAPERVLSSYDPPTITGEIRLLAWRTLARFRYGGSDRRIRTTHSDKGNQRPAHRRADYYYWQRRGSSGDEALNLA